MTDKQKIILYITLGCVCLAFSSLCLFVSTMEAVDTKEGLVAAGYWLFVARLAGITAFFFGTALIFHQRWTVGTLMIVSSFILPIISLFLHGKL